jgi:mRNA interferase RelE/StbE
MYAVEFLPVAARALAKLDRAVQRRIGRRINSLASDPRAGAVKLRGADDVWRVRLGDYRILYLIEDERLVVAGVRIAHRREAERGRLVGRKQSGRDAIDEIYGSMKMDEPVDEYIERTRGR